VRNSVKVVVNAYTGAMKFYANDPNDPILKAYRAAFPEMFHPMSQMPEAIRTHLRYPSNIFSVQAATLGEVPHLNAERVLLGVGPLGDLAYDRIGHAEPVARVDPDDGQRGQRRVVVTRAHEPDLPSGIAARGESPATASRTSPTCRPVTRRPSRASRPS
jgi:hypothetical protein